MNVVIVGGGVIGSAIAYYLSLKGIGAQIVEACAVGCAASGKSGGFLARDGCAGQTHDHLARTSFDLHRDLSQTITADYGYRRVTTFAVAVSALRSFSAVPRKLGSDWIDGDCVVHQVLGDETNTAQLHPGLFTQALVDEAIKRGASLTIGEVKDIVVERGRVVGVQLEEHDVKADVVVIAMGPWSILAARWFTLPAVYGLKGYSITMQPAESVPATLPAETLFLDYEDESGERHGPELVPRADGEVYICGFSDESPLPLSPRDVSVDETACRRLHAIAGQVSSVLTDSTMVRRQACYRPICMDAMPLMGAIPDVAGAYIATGHNCWGMLNAPASGYAMAELIAEGSARTIDLSRFAPERLETIRLQA